MRTSTLILWSLVCGIVILLAGGAKLWQIAADDTTVEFLAAGDDVVIGDATVAALSLRDESSATLVTVTMAGAGDTDVSTTWRLLAGGVVHRPVSTVGVNGGECVAVVDNPVTCIIEFPATRGVRTVAYVRGGVQRQWALSP